MNNLFKILLPSALFLLTLFVVGTNLGKPFWGEHDWNGARYGNIAKNYLRYGLIETKFGQVENGGLSSPQDFIYYTHYQPLLPLLIDASYKVSGVSETATRIIPVIATAGFITALYFIGLELLNWQTGLFASLLALATPMLRYYGKNPVHEPVALFFGSFAFLGALIHKKKNKNGWVLLLIGFILTALTNWSFVFLLTALILFLYDKKNKKNLIFLCFLALVLVGFQFVHAKILTSSFLGGGLGDAFLERTSLANPVVKFSLVEYILRIRLWSSTLFTNPLIISAFVGLVILLKGKIFVFKKLILSLIIYCLYPIFFANASFIHSYFIYYFLFPLSLLGGYLCFRLFKYKKILLILVLSIVAAVWFERADYLKALNESSGDKLAVEISKGIKDNTPAGETVLVQPSDYAFSRLPILSYYSDRNVIYSGTGDWEVKVSGEKYAITKTTAK